MENLFTPYLFPMMLSAIITLLGMRFVLDFFPRWKLLDKPKKYGLTRKPIPYGTGVILFLNFIIVSIFFLPIDAKLVGLFSGATLLVVTGLADDFFGLKPETRLFIQILSALIIIISGYEVFSITNPFGGTIPLDTVRITFGALAISVFSALFLIVWIVGMVNTVNFLDGVPGLASGIATIAGIVLFLLAVRPDFHVVNQQNFALLVGILTASTAVFWIFDLPPPKLLMGNTGSTFLGFMLAIFAIFAGAKIATAFIVMGFPIFDVLMTVMRRLAQKKSPFRGDKQHLHHDLLRAGLSERQTNLVIYGLSGLFGLTALFLGSFQKLVAITIIFMVMAVLKISLIRMAKR